MQLEADLSLLTFSGKKRRKHSIMTELFLSLKYHVWNPASRLAGTVVYMLQLDGSDGTVVFPYFCYQLSWKF